MLDPVAKTCNTSGMTALAHICCIIIAS